MNDLPDIFAPAIPLEKEQLRGLSGIYRITSPSGRVYVGQAQCIHTRWNGHKYNKKKNRIVRASFEKYGAAAHQFDVVEIVPDLARLDEREQAWMNAMFNAGVKTMNVSPTAGSSRGVKQTEEQRARNGERMREFFKNNPEMRKLQSERARNYVNRPGVRERLAELAREQANQPGARERMSQRMREYLNRPGVRERMAEMVRERLSDPEVRARMSVSRQEYLSKPGARERLAELTREQMTRPERLAQVTEQWQDFWSNEEERKKQSEKQKIQMNTPERLEQHSKLFKEMWQDEERAKHIFKAKGQNVYVVGYGIFQSAKKAFEELGIVNRPGGFAVAVKYREEIKKNNCVTFFEKNGKQWTFYAMGKPTEPRYTEIEAMANAEK